MTTTKRPPPPKPEPRKDLAINREFEDRAKALLRGALTDTGHDYGSLADRLNAMGVEITGRGVENKISRGSFSAVFLLQCLVALEVEEISTGAE